MEEIIIVVCAAILDLAINYKWIEVLRIDLNQNDNSWEFPSHKWSTIIRGVFLVGFVFIFSFVFLLFTPLYWFIFHYGLNLTRGKDLLYLGNNTIDRLLSKIDNRIGGVARLLLHFVFTTISALTGWMI